MNRCFPGDLDSEVYEERLAAKVLEEIEGLKVIDLHSTKSKPTPFAFFIGDKTDMIRKTGVERAVNLSYMPETMMNYMNGISIECGYQKSGKAVENAYRAVTNFLAAEGLIDRDYSLSSPELFEIFDEAMGENFDFKAENFRKVEEGEVYAVNCSKKKVAQQDFHPILMSTDGYDHKIGYKGRKLN